MKEGRDKSEGGSMMKRSMREEREIDYRNWSRRRKRRKREISNMMEVFQREGRRKG